MTFQVSDIKVVFDRLFRHLWSEREKTKKMKKLLNRKTLQINLKRNDNQSGSIFMNMQCIVGSPEGKIYSRIFRIYHILLLKLLYFTDIKKRCWITERQTRKNLLNRRIHSVSRFSVVLFLQDWIECFTESLDFSAKLHFNRVSVFLLRLFSVREIPVILSLDYRPHQKHLVFSLWWSQ